VLKGQWVRNLLTKAFVLWQRYVRVYLRQFGFHETKTDHDEFKSRLCDNTLNHRSIMRLSNVLVYQMCWWNDETGVLWVVEIKKWRFPQMMLRNINTWFHRFDTIIDLSTGRHIEGKQGCNIQHPEIRSIRGFVMSGLFRLFFRQLSTQRIQIDEDEWTIAFINVDCGIRW
jgi:hypothetical protein